MEIPSSHAGVVKELKVKVGDKVNEGTLMLTLEAARPAQRRRRPRRRGAGAPRRAPAAAARTPPLPAAPAAPGARAAPPAPRTVGGDIDCDMLVLGAGPGGYSAAFRAADLGMKIVLVERYATLGGVCLNVGCIPSKALLHVAAVMDEVAHFGARRRRRSARRRSTSPSCVAHKNKVVGKLTGGLAAMAKMRKVTVVQRQRPRSSTRTTSSSRLAAGGTKTIGFKHAIIAAGSEAVQLPFMPKDDPRIVDSTGALELPADSEAHADRRRRHHRPRDGNGVFDARRAASTWSRCSTA